MTPEDRAIRAEEARQLLGNTMLRKAFEAVGNHLDAAALSCDPDNAEKARRIVISKQLLAAVEREISRVVADGEIAKVQIQELEARRGLLASFRR